MSVQSIFTGPSDRERLAALGDVDQRERDAVEEAKNRRIDRDILALPDSAFDIECTPERVCVSCAAHGVFRWLRTCEQFGHHSTLNRRSA